MGKKFLTREEQEKTEGYQDQKVDVPAARFQTEQQKVPATAGMKTGTPDVGFGKKKTQTGGAILKQEVAARVVDSGIGGEVPESAAAVRGLSYGGNEGTILGSAAYTPIAGQSRADSRTGKKLDAIAKKLNFVPSEQVEESFDESKALAENPDAVQGYNGSPRNTNARAQKNVGGVPAELLFQRSIDEIKRDQLYFSTGQVVKESGVVYADTPTIVPELQSNGVYVYPKEDNYTLNRGNYLHRAMRIKVDAQGRITKMAFDTLNLSDTESDTTIVNDSSANSLIDMNYAEMDRQNIDHKAGDEKAEIWSPLARAIKQPTRTVGYLRDIENITGSEVFLSYKKTAAAMSYQLNRAAKDGMKLVTPMAEALLGLGANETNSTLYSTYSTDDIFSSDEYLKGAASLYIALYDSVTKYNNKADVLLQPRSLKLALQAADNNMNPLRVKSDLVKVINAREVFSTIDREYDPLQPVCISDKAALIHCYDFNDLYAFDSLDDNGEPVFRKTPFIYMYGDLRNSYVVQAGIPLLRGMHQYLKSIGPKLASIDHGALINKEIVVPMTHSTCYFSLWSLFVLSATPFITRERVNSLRDVLYYEKNVEYPFHQLITIKDANPMNAVQYSNSDYQMPLVSKRMSPACALTWVLPEVFWPFDENSSGKDGYLYVMPWYVNQVDYNYTIGSIDRASGKYSMSMPSVRAGARFGYLDDIFSMSERDVRLSLDRLTRMPNFSVGSGRQGVYKYSQNADGIPFAKINDEDYTVEKFLQLPRELGWFIVAPAGVLTKIRSHDDPEGVYLAGSDPIQGQTSYVAKYWHGRVDDESKEPRSILMKTTINVNRSSAYKQDWDAITATAKLSQNETEWGFVLSLNDLFDNNGNKTLIEGKGKFIPFTTGVVNNGAEGVYEDTSVYEVVSLQKALWTRIQKLPFAISPFDMRLYKNLGEDALKADPFDFLYYFGLAGFKASEYDEDVYNRSNEIINQGFAFMRDPFVTASPLFKEAGAETQSTNDATLVH